MKNKVKNFFAELFYFIFAVLFVSFLTMAVLELIWPGFVVNWFNTNIFLIVLLAVAIIAVFLPRESKLISSCRYYALTISAVIISIILMWRASAGLGLRGYLLTFITGIIVLIILLLLRKSED